jgi:hypothetical protein
MLARRARRRAGAGVAPQHRHRRRRIVAAAHAEGDALQHARRREYGAARGALHARRLRTLQRHAEHDRCRRERRGVLAALERVPGHRELDVAGRDARGARRHDAHARARARSHAHPADHRHADAREALRRGVDVRVADAVGQARERARKPLVGALAGLHARTDERKGVLLLLLRRAAAAAAAQGRRAARGREQVRRVGARLLAAEAHQKPRGRGLVTPAVRGGVLELDAVHEPVVHDRARRRRVREDADELALDLVPHPLLGGAERPHAAARRLAA